MATAQKKIKLISGSLKPLKGVKSCNLTFTYDSMLIGVGQQEEAYLASKRSQWNQKEPGKGDEFCKIWVDARPGLYERSFKQSFYVFSKLRLDDPNAKYTLILKTTRTEGGWDAVMMGHPGEIDGELWVVETADASKVIAKIAFFEATGETKSAGDFEMKERIQSAYLIAGKGLGNYWMEKTK